MEWTATIADQTWSLIWSGPGAVPAGRDHGSSAVCLTEDGVVLVSRDGECWELPAGRPEPGEDRLATLRREVREEACCEVGTAELLGFTVSTCLEGRQRGVVLVRAHWAARAAVLPWRPEHEMVQRRQVPLDTLMSSLTIEPGLEGVHQEICRLAQHALAEHTLAEHALAESSRGPLLPGRGVLLVDDLARATGLDRDAVVELMRTELVEDALWQDEDREDPFGVFDDVLPSRERLAALGLVVHEDYEPEALRSFKMTDDEPGAG